MLTLFRALIGDFDVEAMIKVDRLVGPLLFILFIILGSLFLLNVFIAILSEAYEKAKIQVFGDSFDEHDELWSGMPTPPPTHTPPAPPRRTTDADDVVPT